jgi:hypothetical protein
MRGHGFKFHVWPRNPRGTLIASHGCMGCWTWIATPNIKFEDMTPGRACPRVVCSEDFTHPTC